jgi:hypothetical protein
MDQERGRGDAKIMVAQPAGLLFTAREIGDEVLDGVEQRTISRKAMPFAPGDI